MDPTAKKPVHQVRVPEGTTEERLLELKKLGLQDAQERVDDLQQHFGNDATLSVYASHDQDESVINFYLNITF